MALAGALAVLAAAAALAPGMPGALRAALALPLLLALPGYALLAALAPGNRLDRLERGVLALALSPVLAILVGVALVAGGVGLRAAPLAVALAGATVALAAAAAVRRKAGGAAAPRLPRPPRVVASSRGELAATALAAALLLAAAGAAGMVLSRPVAPEPFTEFYVLDDQGRLPAGAAVPVGEPLRFTVHVTSHEDQPGEYRLTVLELPPDENGAEEPTGGTQLHEAEAALAPGQAWSHPVALALEPGWHLVAFRLEGGSRDPLWLRLEVRVGPALAGEAA